jgi:hypothetical protein
VRRAMPELSGFGKYVRFVHTENLIHNPDQQMSYSVKGANRPAVSGPRHPQMRVVRAVPGPVEGHHDFGRKHSDGKPGHRPSNAIQHVCELEGTRGIVVEAGSVDSHAGRPRALLQVAKTMGQAELWFGAGRRAQGAGRRAQGAGRRAQGVVVCLIGSGVGASIIANGAALRGSTASAGRVGEHHRHGGRPRLPVRGARVPGGLCRCRGNSRPVRRPAAR